MNAGLLFKEFEYSVPASVLETHQELHFRNLLLSAHVLLVKLNFAQSRLKIDGDWQYLLSNQKQTSQRTHTQHDQVSIDMRMTPSGIQIDLNQESADCIILTMEGIMTDRQQRTDCSGLLVLDKIRIDNGCKFSKWVITLYIYDSDFEAFEIKLRLPLSVDKHNGAYN